MVRSRGEKIKVDVHYLGHASFVLQFDNGVAVLTDYGASNAYGLNSPVCGLGTLQPDVATYSHQTHIDHAGGEIPAGVPHVLTGLDRLSLKRLSIEPLRTCEMSLEEEDNTSYLFAYGGLTVLHLADAQAYLRNIDREDVRERVKQVYPRQYDLLLMTIEGRQELIRQAEVFIDLLQPRRVIPMHYWSTEYKAAFLDYLQARNEVAGKSYRVHRVGGARYALSDSEVGVAPVQVISLDPAPFESTA